MPAPLSRWLYVPSAVKTEIQRHPRSLTAFFSGPFGSWVQQLPKSLELDTTQIKSHSRIKVGPSTAAVNFRAELLGHKAARNTSGRPGPIFSALNRAMVGSDVGFKGYLRVRGVGYRFQMEQADLKAKVTTKEPMADCPHLHISAGLSHPLIIPINPEFSTALTRKFRMIRFRSKGLNSLTQTLATLRALRPPDVYKGKGIRYRKDTVIKKEGKKKKA